MNEHAPILNSSGNQVALLLSGSWRRSPPTLDVPASSLTRVLPLLVSSGVGALAWWRLRNASAIPTQALLREIYLRYAVSAVQHQEQVRAIVEVLRSHGIDPILVKGWAVARLYGEAGLRPSGDIDLIVPPTQRAKAESAIKQDKQCRHYWIDFDHAELAQYHDDFRELYERSEIVDLDGSPIRVLGPEDQLRFLCLHFLKHGATRPLWLCDIGAALESKRPAFDWDLFLGKAEPSASWIACTVILAQQLLGAEVENTPIRQPAITPPQWLAASILAQWSRPYPANQPSFVTQIKRAGWKRALSTLPQRWPNAIQATVDTQARFDVRSPLPLQLRNCVDRFLKLDWHS